MPMQLRDSFTDDAAAKAFRAEVERRSGKAAVFVPDAR
jgi:hypothetical protein